MTKGQEKEVLYNDFVHDHGRRLATLYIEKIESLIHSKNLNIEFMDVDEIIEKEEGCKISEIFEKKGEIEFRKQYHCNS